MSSQPRSAFFYGTLMAPAVLHRVCHGPYSRNNPLYVIHNLAPHAAILHDHRRHRVRGADYPAILPVPGSTVRGVYVTGLTDADVWRLDIFEGSEYRREQVKVRLLTREGEESSGKGNVEGEEVQAETYVWIGDREDLEDDEWDFAEFCREKMRFWVGVQGDGEYAEVDEAVEVASKTHDQQKDRTGGRGANGHITTALEGSRDDLVDL